MPDDEFTDGEANEADDLAVKSPQLEKFQLVYEPSPVVAPDGGYGWIVVVAAFFVNLIADGVTFSFGILLSELFKNLDDTREDISWIGSFLAGVPLLMGPITSLLIDRYGCRLVTLVGGLISGLGFALMFVLPQSTLLYVFSGGLLAGFGLGLVFMPAVVAVSFYFLEKRALATGIAMSGSGVGTVVFAYITQACIDEYTWRGSFLIVGGILLNVCICGALYRPLEPADFKKMKRMNKLYVQFQESTQQQLLQLDQQQQQLPHQPPPQERTSTPPLTPPSTPLSMANNAATAAAPASPLVADEFAFPAAKSLLSIPTYLVDEFNQLQQSPTQPRQQQQASTPDERQLIATLKIAYLQRLASEVSSENGSTENAAAVHDGDDVADSTAPANSSSSSSKAMAKANTSHELIDLAKRSASNSTANPANDRAAAFAAADAAACAGEVGSSKPLERDESVKKPEKLDLTDQLKISLLPPQPQQQPPMGPQRPPQAALRLRSQFPVYRRFFLRDRQHHAVGLNATVELWDSCPEFGRIQLANRSSSGPARASASGSFSLSSLLRRVAKSKPFQDMRFLFTSWDYIAFLASNFLLYFWYDITYTFLPDHAEEIGFGTSNISLTIGLIGVSNTIGQIAIGYVGDFPQVDSALLYALCMSLTGVANLLVPWCLDLASLLVYGIIYGFLVSANYSLCSIVIIDLFGLEKLTTGYGFMMFFQGVANLVGPPAMGHMRDTDGNYNRAFIYSGIFVFVSNLLILQIYRTFYQRVRACSRRCCGDAKPAERPARQEPLTPAA